MKKHIAWKIYFWPFSALAIYSNYDSFAYDSIWQIISYLRNLLVCIGLIGAFGYIYNKKIFNNLFWKIFFWIALYDEVIMFCEDFWKHIPLELPNPYSIEYFLEQKYYMFFDGIIIALLFPFYLSIFLYAYRSKTIWINQQNNDLYKTK